MTEDSNFTEFRCRLHHKLAINRQEIASPTEQNKMATI